MLIKQKIDEEKEKKIDELKDKFIEYQGIVSELRKKGKDTSIAELQLLDIPAKMKIANITQDEKDIENIRSAIKQLKQEISEIESGSDFDRIHILILETFEHLRKDEKEKAKEKYREIMRIYRELTKELKQTVYSACAELNKRLQ